MEPPFGWVRLQGRPIEFHHLLRSGLTAGGCGQRKTGAPGGRFCPLGQSERVGIRHPPFFPSWGWPATEKLAAWKGRGLNLKGTGFSPYIKATKSAGFSPEGMHLGGFRPQQSLFRNLWNLTENLLYKKSERSSSASQTTRDSAGAGR